MYNRVCLIGSVWEIKKLKDNNIYLKVSTTRPFVSDDFEYTRDFLNIIIWKEYYNDIKKLIKVGVMIFVEGRIESKIVNDDKVEPNNFIVAENLLILCHDEIHCWKDLKALKLKQKN